MVAAELIVDEDERTPLRWPCGGDPCCIRVGLDDLRTDLPDTDDVDGHAVDV